ncbi:hypothetical protein [Cohnella yongneupensis]|uniref:Uncharacterized protein n=1 Tax=Cohnella yongneupensis TaxID=425006 RepID=A0ABW0QUI5_9BACL
MTRFIGIDPSTKTGILAMNPEGTVLFGRDIVGKGKVDPERLITLVREVMEHIQDGDIVSIEGFSFGSKGQFIGQQFYIGWAIRANLFARNIPYYEVAPMSLKKFAGATGNKDGNGDAIKSDKIEVAKQVLKRWGFESGSDNVTDAYVLARISEAIWLRQSHRPEFILSSYPKFQEEVIDTVLKVKVPAKKKAKSS